MVVVVVYGEGEAEAREASQGRASNEIEWLRWAPLRVNQESQRSAAHQSRASQPAQGLKGSRARGRRADLSRPLELRVCSLPARRPPTEARIFPRRFRLIFRGQEGGSSAPESPNSGGGRGALAAARPGVGLRTKNAIPKSIPTCHFYSALLLPRHNNTLSLSRKAIVRGLNSFLRAACLATIAHLGGAALRGRVGVSEVKAHAGVRVHKFSFTAHLCK